MRRTDFRSAKEGEDLTLATYDGHAVARGNSDGMVVCIRGGSEAHIAKLELRGEYAKDYAKYYPELTKLTGQPVDCRFVEAGNGYSSDCFVINGVKLPMVYVAPGTTFYLGEKRGVSIETRLGVDDPSIALDHRETVDEMPTHERATARARGLCSIVR